MQTNYLEDVPEEGLVFHRTTNINTGQLDNIGTLTRTGFYGQMRQKIEFLSLKKMVIKKITYSPTAKYDGVNVCDVVWLFFLQRSWGSC